MLKTAEGTQEQQGTLIHNAAGRVAFRLGAAGFRDFCLSESQPICETLSVLSQQQQSRGKAPHKNQTLVRGKYCMYLCKILQDAAADNEDK